MKGDLCEIFVRFSRDARVAFILITSIKEGRFLEHSSEKSAAEKTGKIEKYAKASKQNRHRFMVMIIIWHYAFCFCRTVLFLFFFFSRDRLCFSPFFLKNLCFGKKQLGQFKFDPLRPSIIKKCCWALIFMCFSWKLN